MHSASSEEEKLWLVNNKDEPVQDGWQWRSAKNWRDFRVINAFIKNADGKLWIPRRTATKRVFPLCLDMSIGGHVEYGESYEDAFRRETFEEVRIDVTKTKATLIGYLNPFEHDLSAWMKVWEICLDEVPSYNQNDFIEWNWMSPDEFRLHMQNGDKAKSDLPKLVDLFYPEGSEGPKFYL